MKKVMYRRFVGCGHAHRKLDLKHQQFYPMIGSDETTSVVAKQKISGPATIFLQLATFLLPEGIGQYTITIFHQYSIIYYIISITCYHHVPSISHHIFCLVLFFFFVLPINPHSCWFEITVHTQPISHRIHVWYNANIWGILMVNVTIYSIHGSYGYCQKLHTLW